MNDYEADIDAIDESLWDNYLVECERQGIHPSHSDYLVWLEDNYD